MRAYDTIMDAIADLLNKGWALGALAAFVLFGTIMVFRGAIVQVEKDRAKSEACAQASDKIADLERKIQQCQRAEVVK